MTQNAEPTLSVELASRSEAVTDIVKGLRTNDAESTTASIAGLVVSLASGIPLLGKLAQEGARWVFARTAYGRLQKVAAEINQELDQAAQERRIAESVSQLVAQSLLQLGEQRPPVERLVGKIDPRFESFGKDFGTEYVRVRQHLVDGRATGVSLSDPKGRSIDIEIDHVTGDAIGVKL